jgi:hypothetical protein
MAVRSEEGMERAEAEEAWEKAQMTRNQWETESEFRQEAKRDHPFH